METAAHPRFLFKPRTLGTIFVTLTSSASLRSGVVKTFRCVPRRLLCGALHIARDGCAYCSAMDRADQLMTSGRNFTWMETPTWLCHGASRALRSFCEERSRASKRNLLDTKGSHNTHQRILASKPSRTSRGTQHGFYAAACGTPSGLQQGVHKD